MTMDRANSGNTPHTFNTTETVPLDPVSSTPNVSGFEARPEQGASQPRRWSKKARRWVIAGAATLVLLVAAVFATELILRQVIPQKFAGHVRELINLSEDHPVDITLNGWLTGQLIAGSFTDVSIAVPDAPLVEGMRADLFGSADSMPTEPTGGEFKNAVIGVRFSEDQLGTVVQMLSSGIGEDVMIEDGEIMISRSLSLFGQQVPLTVRLEASAVNGQLHVDPISVDAAGLVELTADQLSNIPMFSGLAGGLDLCVSDKLPVGAELDDISLSSTQTLTVELTLDPRLGVDPELQKLGECPK